jgi:hypothetical protein
MNGAGNRGRGSFGFDAYDEDPSFEDDTSDAARAPTLAPLPPNELASLGDPERVMVDGLPSHEAFDGAPELMVGDSVQLRGGSEPERSTVCLFVPATLWGIVLVSDGPLDIIDLRIGTRAVLVAGSPIAGPLEALPHEYVLGSIMCRVALPKLSVSPGIHCTAHVRAHADPVTFRWGVYGVHEEILTDRG